MALTSGDVVDQKYRIVRLLGEGGMGAVYEGENTRIHRRVAIKVLHSAVAGSQDAVQRFEREAQAAGRIGSEHIVEVLDLGHLENGDRYMVMEFLEGESLSERIEVRGRLQGQGVAQIVVQLLDGLQAAHEAGIIHRDLKPDNVFLLASRSGHRDFVKILDFGISKFNTVNGEFSMTRTGAVMGTPYYMSPEQAKGNRNVDLRADLYAVGVILYEALAGEVPFKAETFNELLFKIVLESAVPLTEKVPELDPALAAIVEKAMARDPVQRYQSAREMQQALRDWLAGAPPVVDATLSHGTPRGVGLHGDTLSSPDLEQTAVPPDAAKAVAGAPGVDSASAEKGPRQRTQGAWSASGNYGSQAGSAARRWPLYAVAAAVVLSLVGGGAYALAVSGEDEATARALAKQAEQEKAAAARRAEELMRQAEEARAEAEWAKAERARLEAEALKSAAERERLEAERLAAEKVERELAEARAARSAARRRPAAGSAPKDPPSSPPTPAPNSGRVIRTDL